MHYKRGLSSAASLFMILWLLASPGVASAQTARQAAITRATATAHANDGVVLVYDSETDSWTPVTGPGGWPLSSSSEREHAVVPTAASLLESHDLRTTTKACIMAGVLSISACNDQAIEYKAVLPKSDVPVTKYMEELDTNDLEDLKIGTKEFRTIKQILQGNSELADQNECVAGADDASAAFGDGVSDIVGDAASATAEDFGEDVIEVVVIVVVFP